MSEASKNNSAVIRTYLFVIPLVANAICLVFCLMGVRHTDSLWPYFVGLLYFLFLGFSYNNLEDSRELFKVINRKERAYRKATQSLNIPFYPPLENEGSIYIKGHKDEYGYWYNINIKLSPYYPSTCYELKIKDWEFKVFASNWYTELRYILSEIEEQGYEIEAIKNKYGQWLWYKSEKPINKKWRCFISYTRLSLLKLLVLIAIAMPIAYLFYISPFFPLGNC